MCTERWSSAGERVPPTGPAGADRGRLRRRTSRRLAGGDPGGRGGRGGRPAARPGRGVGRAGWRPRLPGPPADAGCRAAGWGVRLRAAVRARPTRAGRPGARAALVRREADRHRRGHRGDGRCRGGPARRGHRHRLSLALSGHRGAGGRAPGHRPLPPAAGLVARQGAGAGLVAAAGRLRRPARRADHPPVRPGQVPGRRGHQCPRRGWPIPPSHRCTLRGRAGRVHRGPPLRLRCGRVGLLQLPAAARPPDRPGAHLRGPGPGALRDHVGDRRRPITAGGGGHSGRAGRRRPRLRVRRPRAAGRRPGAVRGGTPQPPDCPGRRPCGPRRPGPDWLSACGCCCWPITTGQGRAAPRPCCWPARRCCASAATSRYRSRSGSRTPPPPPGRCGSRPSPVRGRGPRPAAAWPPRPPGPPGTPSTACWTRPGRMWPTSTTCSRGSPCRWSTSSWPAGCRSSRPCTTTSRSAPTTGSTPAAGRASAAWAAATGTWFATAAWRGRHGGAWPRPRPSTPTAVAWAASGSGSTCSWRPAATCGTAWWRAAYRPGHRGAQPGRAPTRPAPGGQTQPGPLPLHTGRLVAEKGLDDLLTAAGLLRGLATVELFGEGRLAQALKSRVAREGLPVRLHGFAGRGRLADELAATTATVLPARWPENCPLAILEAAARAVPAVATTAGGIPELVEDGRTGLLVPPGDPTALAEAMAALAGDPARAVELGRAARRRVAARHDPGGHADALLDCYRRAIARAS